MKQLIRKTLLVLIGGVMCNAAWAENSTTLGNNDNTTAYLGAQNRYTLAPNKTLSLTFTNYAGTLNFYNWDIVIVDKDVVFDDSDINQCYVRYRADNFGDGPKFNDSYNGCTWDWGTFLTHVNGATVNLTIEREGSTIKYRAVATKEAVSYEQNYRTYNVGDGTQDIDVILTIDHSHLEFADASAAAGTITNTASDTNHEIVGNRDNTSVGGMQLSPMYLLKPGETFKVKYKNYSSKEENHHNWVVNVTNDINRYAGASFTHYIALRADNWENIQWSNSGITSNFNWDAFKNEMDGATVALTVTRDNANVTVRCDITPAVGETARYETFTKACGDGNQDIRVFLSTEKGHLDILPESIEISPIGWGTYVSEYNLDFSQAQDGLSAYAITGRSGSVITKEAVTGIVPAGTPLLVSGTANASYTVPVATSAGSAPVGNLLKAGNGSPVEYEANKTKYVLSKDDYDNPVFKNIVAGTPATVPAGKAYLQFNEEISARELTFDFDSETTAISELTNTNLTNYTNDYFNLAGQRVANPTKGLYIVNGKKVILH